LTSHDLDQLAALIRTEGGALLATWRQQVQQLRSAQHLDVPTLNDHIPDLLEELALALEAGSAETIPESVNEGSPLAHGLQRVEDGFDIAEVVGEYNILRGCLHELAGKNGLNLRGQPFHIINRVLDRAIGSALQTFTTQKALEVQRRREEYLAFVAHDLRTPLNAISLAARVLELLLPGLNTGDEAGQMLKSLRRNAQHLAELVGKVLEENTNLETELGFKLERRFLDLWPLVEVLIHDLHPVAGTSSTQLINEIPDELVVFADANLLRRVFQNLIANGIKYTPRGAIVIGARVLGESGAVECSVSDNGAGIPAEQLEKIFDKGETDPEIAGGMGLGLAIVKTFVEAHGGTVCVESRLNSGSTFRFSLPGQSS